MILFAFCVFLSLGCNSQALLPVMVPVEGGTFEQGSASGDDDERPVRKVSVKSFRIAKTEITVAQWRAYCVDVNKQMPPKPSWPQNDNHPVVNITWQDALDYCAWLSGKTGKRFRLPHESEWEFAAIGGNKTRRLHYSGSNYPDSIGVFRTAGIDRPAPVASKSPNELGIFDMSGNVWEWCDNWYASGLKSIRGGGWVAPAADLRPANRWRNNPADRADYLGFRPVYSDADGSRIMTVNGWMSADDMGYALMHEHIMVDFIGAVAVNKNRYNEDEVFNAALPKLSEAKDAGCSLMLECTPAFIGRDVSLLKRLSAASGMALITNTGYYGASKEKFYPREVYELSAKELAAIWIKEFNEGIDGSGIKPGFIKLGVDQAPLSAAQKKVVEAAAIAHLATGLTIGIHTGNGAAAEEELDILQKYGVAPDALVWIHAQNERNLDYFSRLAAKGVWIEFDNVNKGSLAENLNFLKYMKSKNLLHKILMSQDSGWYNVGEEDGGQFNGYTSVFDNFIPYLLNNGISSEEIDTVFKYNPRKALTVNIRKK